MVRECVRERERESEREREREREIGRESVEHIVVWETLFWFGQMWRSEAQPHSHVNDTKKIHTLGCARRTHVGANTHEEAHTVSSTVTRTEHSPVPTHTHT